MTSGPFSNDSVLVLRDQVNAECGMRKAEGIVELGMQNYELGIEILNLTLNRHLNPGTHPRGTV